jgi:autotransporter-associated beta strand protein
MKKTIVSLIALCVLTIGVKAQTHPRLFFDAADVAGYRAKANTAPWSDMLASIEWNLERCRTTGYDSQYPSTHAMAALHLFRDSGLAPTDWSEQSKLAALYMISAPDASGNPVWAVNGYKSLTRAGRGLRVAIAFDICHSAWAGQTIPATFVAGNGATYSVPAPYAGMDLNAGISLALKNNADSLVASGGSEWPGNTKTANNWFAVRFGTALLSYLACDEPESGWSANYDTCLRELRAHYAANLTTRSDTGGWNPEGVAYAQYPGYFSFPMLYALKRVKGLDLTTEIPALNKTLWATYQGMLPIDRYSRTTAPGDTRLGWGKGLRPDFTDDHNSWDPEGSAALAFAFAPEAYKPGLKWMFRRTCGDLGDQTWDTSSGNGLWSLLFYPNDLAEQNPAAAWGKTYQDPSYGVYVFRNRYQDENDFVMQTHGNFRLNAGGHNGPDALSFRIYGLGVPWTVGSGRTTNPQGQTTLFPADPTTISGMTKRLVPSLVDKFLRANGDGYTIMNIDTSDTGVDNQTRRIVTDYSSASGAPGFFVVSDSSNNGTHWRLNTPSFNTISSSGDTFSITAPDGQVMTAKVLWPQNPVFRTGTFNRPPSLRYKEINYTPATNAYSTINKWIDFEGGGDGKFVVAIAITENGSPIPDISASGSGDQQTITAGTRIITLDGNNITVNGWTRPTIAFTAPTPNQQFNAGPTDVTVTGNVADPDGISRVEISLDGVVLGDATLDGSGGFSYTLTGVPLGEHSIDANVFDGVNDQNSTTVSFKVNSTVPPEVSLTWPGIGQPFQSGQSIIYQGIASDAENNLVRVELWENGVKLGNATLAGSTWSYTRANVPTGRHDVYAEAIDGAGDFTRTPVLQVLASARFAPTNSGDGALWLMSNSTSASAGSPDINGTKRWAIMEHDGDLRLRGRTLKSSDYANHQVFLRDTAQLVNWRLEYQFKIDDFNATNPESYVCFGTGDAGSLRLDMRKTNGLIASHPDNQMGTRIWNPQSAGPRPSVAYSLNPATSPAVPDTDFAGIRNAGWNNVRIDRVGRTMKVYVNNLLILDGDNGYLGTKGSIGLANERNTGSICWYDDIALTRLDTAGQPVAAINLNPVITSPALHAELVAGNMNVGGSADVTATEIDLYLGSAIAATVPVSSGVWSATLALTPGQYAVTAVARDAEGNSTTSAARSFTVSASGGAGGNALPAVTISQNGAVLPPNLEVTGSATDGDGSISLVQVFRDGTLAGNATRSGATWSYTFANLASGSYTITARAYDNLGESSESSALITHDGNQPPTVSAIANQSTPQNTATTGIAFTIGDDATPLDDLALSATSSNTTLLPEVNIVLSGTGANRFVTLTPASGQSGSSSVSLTVTDGGNKSATTVFSLTVTAPPVATIATLSPPGALASAGATVQFAATLRDQYGNAMATQPTWTWSVGGGGSITQSGQFTAGSTPGGPFALQAAGDGFTASGSVTIKESNSNPGDALPGKRWQGGDLAWQQPDSDSFGAETYSSGDDVVFTNTGIGTINVDSTLAPKDLGFTHTTGNFLFAPSVENPLAATGNMRLFSGSTTFRGRPSGAGANWSVAGELSVQGSAMLGLLRNGNDARWSRLLAGSLATPVPGSSLLCNNSGDTSTRWGTNGGSAQNRVVVSGVKPLVTSGIVSAGIQYYASGNSLGDFMKFVDDSGAAPGNNLVPLIAADYTSGFTTAANEVASVPANTLIADESVHAVKVTGALNLGGFRLTVGGGGMITTNTTTSNGIVDFAGGPAWIGAYNGASQSAVSAKITGATGLTILGTSQAFRLENNTNDFIDGLFINGGSVSLTATAAGGNDVTINSLGRLMTSSSGGAPIIGGLSGNGRLAAWFQSGNTTSGTWRITPATGTTHEFSGFIRDGDAGRVLSIIKAGEGQQTFSGTGLHTGTTLIENGTLLVNGDFSAASGNVTASPGSTLGGTGVLGGALDASGTISPGTSAGTLSVANHVTWNGSVSNVWAWELDLDDESDLLFIFGDFIKGSGSSYIFDFGGTGSPGTYKLVEWGGSTSFAAGQFTAQNLGGGLEAVFQITGKQLNLIVTSTGEPTGGYDAWKAGAFPEGTLAGDRAPEVDFDLDGLNNLLEYGLGTNPASPSTMPAAMTVEENGNRYLQIQWSRTDDRDDIITTGEASPDLEANSWSSSPTEVSTTIIPASPGMETVTIRLLEPIGDSTHHFLRARMILEETP